MIEFDASFYDGRTSAHRVVRVSVPAGSLRINGAGLDLSVPLHDLYVEPPLAGTRRAIRLPDGGALLTDDHAAVAKLFPRASRFEGVAHRLERRWPYALAALVVIAVLGTWLVMDGVPFAARVAANLVPIAVEARLGDDVLASIDASVCAPSLLDARHQRALQDDLAAITSGLSDGYHYRLELRLCRGMGPNAFALPGGAIVLTDGLVALAQDDAEITAVLAHEVGHVRRRHGLRLLLQAAGVAGLIDVIGANATSVTNLAAALPAVLIQRGYSRAFESEADEYAFRRLKEIGHSPADLARILTRLEAVQGRSRNTGEASRQVRLPGYLSTHPGIEQRIARALASQ